MTRAHARTRLLEAAFQVIRTKGYEAMRVEDVCTAAGLSKGSFFHHFPSKEALAIATARHWSETTGALFAQAPYHAPADPVERVLAYVDFRKTLLGGDIAAFTCVVGTMVQEVHATHPRLREACGASIRGHAATLEADMAAALDQCGLSAPSAASLALHTQAVIQGAFILAKAGGGIPAAAETLDHLGRYLELLFARTSARETPA